MFRKTIFWLHLGTGVTVALVVAMMSLTGVLLTYEHQLTAWADKENWPKPAHGAERLTVDEIVAASAEADINAKRVTFFADSDVPVLAGGGRRDPSTYIDAYSGDVLGRPSNWMRETMSVLTGWHRWFNAEGEARGTARLVTGISNLAFLFLLVSGAYLWLPKVMRWPLFRERLRFARSYRNSKDRDFHWHHIFGAWSLIPLILVVATAVVFSFSWANDLVFKLVGNSSPQSPAERIQAEPATGNAERLTLDQLFHHAGEHSEDWYSIALTIPDANSPTVSFEIDTGTGRQPHKRNTMILDAYSGEVVGWRLFGDRPASGKIRAWIRFLHTGEAFGLLGQTIAGLVSLASLLMVWTGLALAWRRLIVPLYRKV